MNSLSRILVLVPLLLFAFSSKAQEGKKIVSASVIDGDTVPRIWLNTVYVDDVRKFKSKRQRRKYNHLKYHVKKVYPYAKLAGQLYIKYEDSLALASTHKQRKKFYKQIERELRHEYEEELKKMTVTQGRILIKLVDREIGQTSYEVVKELRSTITAFFWQSLARLFGHDLKAEYDPKGRDRDIENIVVAIERGFIKLDLDHQVRK